MLPILNVALAAAEKASSTAAVAAAEAANFAGVDNKAFFGIAVALCIAIGVLGASKAMGAIASSAIDGTARQPEMSGKLFTTMLIAMALVEALAIYCLLIAFMLYSKI